MRGPDRCVDSQVAGPRAVDGKPGDQAQWRLCRRPKGCKLTKNRGIQHEDEARLLAHRIVRALGAPFVIGGRDVRIGVTVGIAVAPRDGVTLDRLAACADAALYQAKHKGRGSVVFAGEPSGPSAAVTAA